MLIEALKLDERVDYGQEASLEQEHLRNREGRALRGGADGEEENQGKDTSQSKGRECYKEGIDRS